MNKSSLRIYFDMDGLLTDFFGGLADWLGRDRSTLNIRPTGFVDSASLGMTDSDLLALMVRLPSLFWVGLPSRPEGIALLLQLMARHEVVILTRPIPTEACRLGKRLWVNMHLGEAAPEVVFSQEKHRHATPTSILIDDEPGNVARFRAAGGHAILYPCPWHTLPRKDPCSILQEVHSIHRSISQPEPTPTP